MSYKTHKKCDRCCEALVPEGTKLCAGCQKKHALEEEARQCACPICGVEAGFACIIRRWHPGDGYWLGYHTVEQGDAVHHARHPNYVAPKKKVPFWKQSWHFISNKKETPTHLNPREEEAREAARRELEAMLHV